MTLLVCSLEAFSRGPDTNMKTADVENDDAGDEQEETQDDVGNERQNMDDAAMEDLGDELMDVRFEQQGLWKPSPESLMTYADDYADNSGEIEDNCTAAEQSMDGCVEKGGLWKPSPESLMTYAENSTGNSAEMGRDKPLRKKGSAAKRRNLAGAGLLDSSSDEEGLWKSSSDPSIT